LSSTQKQQKLLPTDTFSGLGIYGKYVCGWGSGDKGEGKGMGKRKKGCHDCWGEECPLPVYALVHIFDLGRQRLKVDL